MLKETVQRYICGSLLFLTQQKHLLCLDYNPKFPVNLEYEGIKINLIIGIVNVSIQEYFEEYFEHFVQKLFNKNFIYIAPCPVFSRLEGFNKRMICFMVMFCSVFVLRLITAPHMTAYQAES